MAPPPAPQLVPEKFHYEEELSRIKLDLEAISRTAIMAKRLKKGKLEQLVVMDTEEQTQEEELKDDAEVEEEPAETTEKNEDDGAESKEEDDKAESVIIDIE